MGRTAILPDQSVASRLAPTRRATPQGGRWGFSSLQLPPVARLVLARPSAARYSAAPRIHISLTARTQMEGPRNPAALVVGGDRPCSAETVHGGRRFPCATAGGGAARLEVPRHASGPRAGLMFMTRLLPRSLVMYLYCPPPANPSSAPNGALPQQPPRPWCSTPHEPSDFQERW